MDTRLVVIYDYSRVTVTDVNSYLFFNVSSHFSVVSSYTNMKSVLYMGRN